jgi:hypothetical protein
LQELAQTVCCLTLTIQCTDVEDGATSWEMRVLVSIYIIVCSCDICPKESSLAFLAACVSNKYCTGAPTE